MIKYLAIPAILATSLSAFADDKINAADAMNKAEGAMDVAGNVAECADGKDASSAECQAIADAAMQKVEGATEMKNQAESAVDAAKSLKDAATQ